MYKRMSAIEYGRKFNNFWSSVSKVTLADTVSEKVSHAIVRGLEGVVMPEVKK